MNASAAPSGDAEEWHRTEVQGVPIHLSSEAESSVLDNIPRVSLAASIDPDGNRQLFDLSINGTVRLVRIFRSLVASPIFLGLQYARRVLHSKNMPHGLAGS